MKITSLGKFALMGAVAAAFSAGVSGSAMAAGFYIQEQSPRLQGQSFAGAVANPADASTVFYNPAGMTELDGPQGQVGVSVIIPRADFTDQG